MVVVSYKQKYVHRVLVNCLVKLDQEKSVVRLTDIVNMTIAVVWDVKLNKNVIIKLSLYCFLFTVMSWLPVPLV